VLICVTGGAWIIGVHYWMAMMARVMSACGFIVVTPDYRNFPAALIPHMVNDIDSAIAWTINNIADFHGDPSRIYVVGQSAGAHLTMMSMLRQATRLQTGATESHAPVYNPRRDIRGWIGLSGMYDLGGMTDFLHSRGLYKSVLRRMCGGDISTCSALNQLQRTDPAAIAYQMPLAILFAHGNCDSSAPYSESSHMAALFRAKLVEHGASRSTSREQTPKKAFSAGRPAEFVASEVCQLPQVRLHTITGGTHTTPMVEDFLAGHSEFAALVLALAHRHAAESSVARRVTLPSVASAQSRLALRSELAVDASGAAAVDFALLDASFTNAGSVSFTAGTIATVLESVAAEGNDQAFLHGTPEGTRRGSVASGGGPVGGVATHVKFRPLVFQWQASFASFVSAF
jgi:acetyl esterase/lipase